MSSDLLIFSILHSLVVFVGTSPCGNRGEKGFKRWRKTYQRGGEGNGDAASTPAWGGDALPLLSALILASKHMDMESLQVGLTAVMEARIAFLETKRLPPLFSKRISYRVSSSIFTAAVLVGQGVLIWCR